MIGGYRLTIEKRHNPTPAGQIKPYLEILEKKIDLNHVRRSEKKQLNTFAFHEMEDLPVLVTTRDDVGHNSIGMTSWPVGVC